MTHIAQVRVYHEGAVFNAGEPVEYRGPLDWKYRPNDPDERDAWERDIHAPEWAEDMPRDVGLDASRHVTGEL